MKSEKSKVYRIVFVITKYFDYGGLQKDLIRIAQECQMRGHTVKLVTDKWESNQEKPFAVHEVHLKSVTNHEKNDEIADYVLDLSVKEKIDCIVGFNRMKGLNVYYAGDLCYSFKFSAEKPKMFRFLPRYKALLRQEKEVFQAGLDTEILLIAHQEKQKFSDIYETESERIKLLPPGIDRKFLDSYTPNKDESKKIRHELGIHNDDIMLLMVGSSFHTKGVDRAIKALAALPDELKGRCHLVIAGKGKKSFFERLARKYKLQNQTHFIGVCDNVPRLYVTADCLIHPAYSENTGTVIIEAMYCGLPVLATENCGFSVHLKAADSGLICPVPFKQSQLNQLLNTMIRSEKRESWKQNGIAYCQTHDLYSCIERAADSIISFAEKSQCQM